MKSAQSSLTSRTTETLYSDEGQWLSTYNERALKSMASKANTQIVIAKKLLNGTVATRHVAIRLG